MGDGMGGAESMDRRFGAIHGAVGADHDDRGRAIIEQAAIADGQRIGDHPRREHVLDAERIARGGFRIEPGPLASRHRHLGQLPPRRAVKMHVPARGQRIG